tara:strand:+ start:617 stop:859 length:243 start_codon:yes stop_codon:yes gene_type:complete
MLPDDKNQFTIEATGLVTHKVWARFVVRAHTGEQAEELFTETINNGRDPTYLYEMEVDPEVLEQMDDHEWNTDELIIERN